MNSSASAVITPLFLKGAESFKIVDTKTHKAPEVVVLNADPMELSFATLAGQALHFPADAQGLHLQLEQLTFKPTKSSGKTTSDKRLQLIAKVSGREFPLEQTISQSDFENGKLIIVKFPTETNQASVATLTSSGEIQFRYLSSTATLDIPSGIGDVSYESKLGPSGTRHLKFVGKGNRVMSNAESSGTRTAF